MCIFCAPTQSVGTCPMLSSGSQNAQIIEVSDAVNGQATTYVMAVGDSFEGSLTTSDRDWVAITLEVGDSYTFSMNAAGSGDGSLTDAYLRLFDNAGTQLTYNDDGGTGRDSLVTYEATYTGTYYVAAGAYNDAYAGTYVLTATGYDGSEPGTIDDMATFLTDGFWNGSGFRFDTRSSTDITVNLGGLTADGAQLARWAMEAWETVADIVFVEVGGAAQITFDDNQSGAFAGPNGVSGGYTTDADVNVSTNWLNSYGTTIDSYSFQTYVHEIGHALGLGHQGAYNGSATYGTDETFANDSWQMSIMSYFSQTENSYVDASYATALSAMMVDVVAIQDLYGASAATAGDTIWGMGSNLGTYIDVVMDEFSGGDGGNAINGENFAMTIYDFGGTDTVDFSFTTTATRLDMRAESFSDVGGLIGNIAIARGTVIENARVGGGSDVVTGNGADNIVTAGAGDDNVWAQAGHDTVYGGDGNDTVGGAAGNDVIEGGAGDDVLWGANGMDTLFGGADDDILGGGAWDDSLDGGSGNDSLYGGTGVDIIDGGSGNDTIDGWAHIDVIHGGAGEDVILGGNWGDTLYGDEGNDLIFGDGDTRIPNNFRGSDVIYGGEGDDTILAGDGADTMSGDAGDDVLWGGDGWNVFDGGSGNDRMMGGGHTDRMGGGVGDDEMTGGGAADAFIFRTGTGTDHITDFSFADGDRLEFDDALWLAEHGALAGQQVVDLFASPQGTGDVAFSFDGGEVIILDGFATTDGLGGAIDIF